MHDPETDLTLAAEALQKSTLVAENQEGIDEELTRLEEIMKASPSEEVRLLLLGLYALLSRGGNGGGMLEAVTYRERFQNAFPDHFAVFMTGLKAGRNGNQWPGCLRCRNYVGSGCAIGVAPQRLSSRYLNVDYHCSAFERKT